MKNAPTDQGHGALGEQLTLLPPPAFCPSWPNKNSLADKALRRFLDGDTLDHLDFIGACGSWRLAAVVFQLRTLGWPITTVEVSSPSEEHAGRTIARYKLPAKFAALALALMSGASHA